MDKKKETIAKNLENWYVVDSILFNNHAQKVMVEGESYKEYLAIKSSMLSTVYEYWNHIGYQCSEEAPISEKVLKENAVRSAYEAKASAASILARADVKRRIKSSILKESKARNIPNNQMKQFNDKYVEERHLQISVDNALIGRPMLEMTDSASVKHKADSVKGQLIEESYKILRDSLIRLALTCQKV